MRAIIWQGRFLLLTLLISAVIVPGAAMAQDQKSDTLKDREPNVSQKDDRPTFEPRNKGETVPSQIIVKFKKDANSATRNEARRATGLEKKKDLDLISAEVNKVKGQSVERAIEALERRSDVEYAEPDYINHRLGYADEPEFAKLWGLDNTGQTINGSSGTADIDLNGKEASSVTQGDSNLVVAVIDDGVDFSHPELANRAWKNPGESGSGKETNGVDDDSNGMVDDVNGWDFYYDDKTVHDPSEDAHGTHVSGTIAASVNNQGIVGVAPNIQIMALKFLGPNGGATSDAIDALGYAKSKGAKISNNSWGGAPFSQALKDAIDLSEQLFVAAAGNGGSDGIGDNNDTTPHYPSSYTSPNILSVAAINNQGNLASFSNFGATSVDISAPGVSILSSVPEFPDTPATALSSVGSSGGKAVTAGFGADEVGDSTKRTSFVSKAFTAIDRGSQEVVLVDDDGSSLCTPTPCFPNVGPTLATAIQSATGSAPTVIDVSSGNGPALSQLSGKTVVWATGKAWTSDLSAASTTLTSNDQTTLTDFLNGGGKLVITGMDALYRMEDTSFVKSTLNLSVRAEVGTFGNAKTFNGSSGTAFDGESYTFNSSTANTASHDKVQPAPSSSAVTQGVYPGNPSLWTSFNGTSMATPHATGVAALAASKSPTLLSNPTGLKQAIMDSGKPVSATAGKTVTGDMPDALAALPTEPPNSAPTAADDSYTTNQGTALNQTAPGVLSNDSDDDGDTLTVGTPRPVSGPTNGTLTLQADGSFTYTPNANFNGTDSFTYKAHDGQAESNDVATVRITVIKDTTPPAAPAITSPPNNSYDTDGTIILSGSAEKGSTVRIYEGAILKGATIANSTSGAWSKGLTGLTSARHTYTAKATDKAGNTSLASAPRTIIVDKVKPTILSTVVPASGAVNVPATTNVVATFSEPMKATTLTTSTVRLVRSGTSTPVPAVVSYSPTTKKVTLNPNANLRAGARYTATITTGARDLAGNPLAAAKVWSFTVKR